MLHDGDFKCPICRADRLPALPTTVTSKLAFLFKLVVRTCASGMGGVIVDVAYMMLGLVVMIFVVQDLYLCSGGKFTLHHPPPVNQVVWDREFSISYALFTWVGACCDVLLHLAVLTVYKLFYLTLLVGGGGAFISASCTAMLGYAIGVVDLEMARAWAPYAFDNATLAGA